MIALLCRERKDELASVVLYHTRIQGRRLNARQCSVAVLLCRKIKGPLCGNIAEEIIERVHCSSQSRLFKFPNGSFAYDIDEAQKVLA